MVTFFLIYKILCYTGSLHAFSEQEYDDCKKKASEERKGFEEAVFIVQ